MCKKYTPPSPFISWEEYRIARDAFYQSEEWREIRKKVIKNSDCRCVYCKKYPTDDNPINIDHRIPLCKRWDLRLCLCNLQVTCHKCNKLKSGMSHVKMLKKSNPLECLDKQVKKKKKKEKRLERLRAKKLKEQKIAEKQKQINIKFFSEYLKN